MSIKHGDFCLIGSILLLLVLLPNLANTKASACFNNTFFSYHMEDCMDCPEFPSKHCHDEHRIDIESCLRSCQTGKYCGIFRIKYIERTVIVRHVKI